MAQRRHTPERFIGKLADCQKLIAGGMDLEGVFRQFEIAESTWARWLSQYGSPTVMSAFVPSRAHRADPVRPGQAHYSRLSGCPPREV